MISPITTHQLKVGYKSSYQEVCLFENLNLALPPQKLVCFMGPNGAGKSTLIRTLVGLQQPLSGTIEFASNGPIDGDKISRKVSVVLTDRITASNLSVYDLITFGRYPYLDWTIKLNERDNQIIDQSISLVNISHLIKKNIYELSDGQLQMALIARALAQDTSIIILDEPTAHLDLNNRLEIMKLLKRLTRTANKTILIATHDLDLALQTADTIWLTGKNKNIVSGIPEDLVLNDQFDSIFQFKGFDLKTGKVIHDPYRKATIRLQGEGHCFLWTKNALERNGYRIDPSGEIEIFILENSLQWKITQKENSTQVSSINDLLNYLQTISQ